MELILASSNKHKFQEMQEFCDFPESKLQIRLPDKQIEVEENGTSYTQNALLKASSYWDILKKPVLADDSGLNVDALPDLLGLQTARFGGPGLTSIQRCELLLEKMKDFEEPNLRRAHFTCILCFYLNPKEIFFFEGNLKGAIGQTIKGSDGFGYDPIFLPEGQGLSTLAQLPDWKKIHSHRAKAMAQAQLFFKNA